MKNKNVVNDLIQLSIPILVLTYISFSIPTKFLINLAGIGVGVSHGEFSLFCFCFKKQDS